MNYIRAESYLKNHANDNPPSKKKFYFVGDICELTAYSTEFISPVMGRGVCYVLGW